jgi:3-hydroxyisobutyrate dehydrogenase-like beta-hydroxyacid dehydrogenase
MGRLMAGNLARSQFPLLVYNRTAGVAEEFAARENCDWRATPAELASEADLIVSMLADGDALIEVYQGEKGVLETLAPQSLAIDMGTSGPTAVAKVRAAVEGVGAAMIDAPVSGSLPAAESAKLLIMVGSPEEVFERAKPVLSVMGDPLHVGPPGAAATLKLAVNSILYGLNQALAEAVALAEAAGVLPEKTLDVVTRSAAGAPMVTYRRPQYLDPDDSPITFTLTLAAKDLRLALEQAADSGLSMPQAERTAEVVDQLIAAGFGERDMGFAVEAARRALR